VDTWDDSSSQNHHSRKLSILVFSLFDGLIPLGWQKKVLLHNLFLRDLG